MLAMLALHTACSDDETSGTGSPSGSTSATTGSSTGGTSSGGGDGGNGATGGAGGSTGGSATGGGGAGGMPSTGGSGGTGGSSGGTSLRFYGSGVNDIDRVKIRVDDPADDAPGPPADVGVEDFTLELWLRASAAENTAGPVGCGDNLAWINGNIVIDRDRYNQDRKFGVSIAGGVIVFGVSGDGTGDHTVCGTTDVLDDAWHHVAVIRRRNDGNMWLYVDGLLEADEDGPNGDVSYPDDGYPADFCGGPCTNSDPFLVIAAEKHDAGPAYPSFSGFIDEVRLSNTRRYMSNFMVPTIPFVTDADTVALYHLDEGSGDVVGDSSNAPGGPSDGTRQFGGNPAGPEWSTETPF